MRILLTNDDGITSEGIKALWLELSQIADVFVVAPDAERSAMSQAITVNQPIIVDKYSIENNPPIHGWRVGGTPTDCVKIALETLLDKQPDILISGINHGPNLGTDVLYSGTVSAAIEGSLHNITAIAVSLDSWQTANFGPAAKFTKRLVLQMKEKTLPPNTLLNVNVPAVEESEINGVTIAKLGVRRYENSFDKRRDPRGRTYYWMSGNVLDEEASDTDVAAVKNNKISITPIHFDLTNYRIMNLITEWNIQN